MDLLPGVRHFAPTFSQMLEVDSTKDAGPPMTQVQPLVEPLSKRELEILRS